MRRDLSVHLHIARFLYLRSRDTDVAVARRVAAEHVAFFLTCVTTSERRSS